ncbi:hypothetical protein [Methanospirillum stamsii]|nr:hypothetical protein [Methanospirillum stamsii]
MCFHRVSIRNSLCDGIVTSMFFYTPLGGIIAGAIVEGSKKEQWKSESLLLPIWKKKPS